VKLDSKIKADICDLWRLLGKLGLVDTVFNHISLCFRNSNDELLLVINKEGKLAESCTIEDFIILPVKPRTNYSSISEVNIDGLKIHMEIAIERNCEGVVIHTHSMFTTIVGLSGDEILPLTQTATEFMTDSIFIEYGGLFRNSSINHEKSNLLNQSRCFLLKNHGALTVAKDIPEAFYLIYYLEEVCKSQVLALSQNIPLREIEAELAQESEKLLKNDRDKYAKILYQAFINKYK
jgi:ribulose-5-phosphate 4-epimerase/fuculose-1-phosphate aldolase